MELVEKGALSTVMMSGLSKVRKQNHFCEAVMGWSTWNKR
jgi:hypothetical protein